ncbi:MAG: hypothetical protein ACETWG_05520, partial [Candidatus Neomarinimicrobiota bacterium]
MNKYAILIAITSVLIGLIGCDTTEPEDESDFALYFLANDSMGTYEAMQQGISRLELELEPWLSEKDIEFYDFSTHFIYLKTDKGDFFEGYDEDNRINFLLVDKPFVVVAGGSRCYIGSLHDPLLA